LRIEVSKTASRQSLLSLQCERKRERERKGRGREREREREEGEREGEEEGVLLKSLCYPAALSRCSAAP